jgi:biopolymer transport protein ExbB/TolQ
MLTRLPNRTQPIRVRSTPVLVGLFGATAGAVNALTSVASGHTRLESVSAGVAETLVTTAVALLVVIPALWMYNQFKQRRDRD